MSVLTVLQGDCRDTILTLPDQSVQCCVTSPPYFGLRAYLPANHPDKHREIGQEKTPQEFVATLVGVFEQVKRVLRDDGVLFVNLADSYASGGGGGASDKSKLNRGKGVGDGEKIRLMDVFTRNAAAFGMKPKDLCLVPQRFVIAMQEAGWYVRDVITWVKRAPMPEGVKDRFTKATEPIFMFTKSARYYFDVDAVKEPANTAPVMRDKMGEGYQADYPHGDRFSAGGRIWGAEMRQMRNAWILSPEPTPDAHFATYPTEIPRRCILATTKPGDTVLDVFGGSGTTGKVALELGRKAILCELNEEYTRIIEKRTTVTLGLGF